MAVVYSQETVSSDVDRELLIYMIINDEVCKKVIPIMKLEYFKSPYCRFVFNEIKEYFVEFKKAPKVHIKDRFKDKEALMEHHKFTDLVGQLLMDLNEQYDDPDINADFVLTRARNFAQKRNNEIFIAKMEAATKKEKWDEVEKLRQEYRGVAKEIAGIFIPDEETTRSIFHDDEDEGEALFRLPGELGTLLKDFKRTKLYSFMAPLKRGKSWSLMQCALSAVEAKKKVLYFTFEMPPKEVWKDRMLNKIAMSSSEDQPVIFSALDCKKQQLGQCKMEEKSWHGELDLSSDQRKAALTVLSQDHIAGPVIREPQPSIKALDAKAEKQRIIDFYDSEFDRVEDYLRLSPHEMTYFMSNDLEPSKRNRVSAEPYKPCTYCKDKQLPGFEPTVFPAIMWPKHQTEEVAINALRRYNEMYRVEYRLRLVDMLGYTDTFADIHDRIEGCIDLYNFIPDVVIIDYLDIIAFERKPLSERDDSRWAAAKSLAKKYNVAVITANQGNRPSINKPYIEETDIAEDIRKGAWVDFMYGIAQSENEHECGIYNVSVLIGRGKKYWQGDRVFVISNYDVGNPIQAQTWDKKTYQKRFKHVK